MIGMNQIKRRTYIGLGIGLAIGAVCVGLTIWWSISTIKSYENGTNQNYLNKYTKLVTVPNKDIVQGQVITSDMLVQKRIHISTVPTGALDLSKVSGQVAKYNISANTPITSNMVASNLLTADVREQEINTVLMPSDLVEGDYIDIRITYPNGTDYVVLSQKIVDKIANQTMWIKLSEDERLLLNSAVVDSYLTQGSKIYATKYADPGSQIKIGDDTNDSVKGYLNTLISNDMDTLKSGDQDKITTSVYDMIVKYSNFADAVTKTIVNYQPNSQVIDMMKADANIVNNATSKLSSDARTIIDNANSSYESQNQDKFNNVVTGAQQSITAQQTERNSLLNQSTSGTTTTTTAQ